MVARQTSNLEAVGSSPTRNVFFRAFYSRISLVTYVILLDLVVILKSSQKLQNDNH